MSKSNLGQLIAQTMAPPAEDRTIEAITGEILDAQQTGGDAVLTIGRCLIEAKKILPHGAWLPWLNEKVSYSDRTARRLMQIYREVTKRPALANLGSTKAMALATMPQEELSEFLKENNVVDMTTRQLEQAIKDRDEARKAAEEAKADAATAEQARAKMAEDMALLNARLAGTREDKELAEQATARLEQELAELKAKPVEVAVETVTDPADIEKARAEAVAEMQDKLDKAKAAKAKAAEKQKAAEEARDQYLSRVEELEKRLKRAEMGGDKEVAQFEALANQIKLLLNPMRGILLKVRGREDQVTARMMENVLRSLSDDIGRCAE